MLSRYNMSYVHLHLCIAKKLLPLLQNQFCMMRKYVMMAAIGLLVGACDNAPKFSVEGSIENAEDSVLVLSHCALDGVQKIDSVKLGKDGAFSFRVDAPVDCPEFYTLSIGRHIINFAVDSTETLIVKASLPRMESEYVIEGNESSEKMREIAVMQQQTQARLVAIERNEGMLPGDKVDSLENILNDYKERIKNGYIFVSPSSAYAYYAVCQSLTDMRGSFMLFNPLTDRSDVKCYATVATAWDGAYPNAARTQQLCNMAIKGMDNTALPQQRALEVDESKISETGIIDINLPDINSRMHSITDLKGKVVLIDFTVYGARESAERTRLMRSMYEKYRAQGFEIYQISLDEDIHFWKYSCENLPWICVHETDGTATRIYGISNLPTFFLVNRNNEIVVRSDFMEGSLESNLQKLL